FYEKVRALHQDPKASVDNPLLAFSLIKRLHSDWPNVVYSDEATENTQALHAGFREVEQELPGAEDLDGAARALMRLQDVYALSVKGMANGVFQQAGTARPLLYSPSRRVSLSADDCFHVGKRLSYGNWNPEDRSSLEDALDHLAFSYFMAGNGSHALGLSKGFLHYATSPPSFPPRVLQLQRPVVASGEKQQKAEYRISKSAWLKDTADPVVRALEQRIAAVTGLDLRPPYAEYLQVVNYGLGGHYEPHFDHATSRKSPLYRMKSGNRIATVMIYLSAVEAGGSTAFIYANFSVPVVKNAALFWWNLRRNGDGDGDTLHAGCPVLAGDKWVANKWIHEHGQEFRRPCGADPRD
ncbi:PREDICTED: prolyl 4-hydroxylase subunit alpha-3, partial [Apaloderma vittatum]|uniref:prolyl 4-hydroxylase subunit alpha-3 n=1 Tax=Apaloderma vittatum TaxID=57397 RepID=UPI0005217824